MTDYVPDHAVQIAAVTELHDDAQPLVGGDEAVEVLHDVRMVHRRQHPHLVFGLAQETNA